MGRHEDLLIKFKELTAKDPEDQAELFLQSFIFALDDDWKKIFVLLKAFRKYLVQANECKQDLNPIQASDFLQKNGLERTALVRKQEVADIDLDNDGRIAFIEYLLLHFKVMILKEYYKRTGEECKENLRRGIGIVGVGPKLLDELFTLPVGLPAELLKAIEEFTAKQKEREEAFKTLRAKAAAGGVKGMAAANEIKQMESQDMTEMNRLELTLNAAKKKAAKSGGDDVLAEKKRAEEEERKKKEAESRAKLKAKAALWEQRG